MKPAPFEYAAPTSLQEAFSMLLEFGPDAKVIAGGQSLVPVMNFRLARPKYLIDLGRIQDLSYIRREGDLIRIGAMTTHADVEESAPLTELCPVLPQAARLIGHAQIRSRGTVGGSIAHADPSAEWPMVMTALDAKFVLSSADGERIVSPADFFLTYLTTTLGPHELITEIQIPVPPASHGWAVQEVTRRHGDFALIAVTALVSWGGGEVAWARLALGGVGGVPVDASDAAAALCGTAASTDAIAGIAAQVAAGLEPDADIHASAEYRREVAETLINRSMAEALERARRGERL